VPFVPVHAPVQPPNAEPAAALAVRTTVDPLLNCDEHVGGQLIALGWLVTVPEPAPEIATVAGKVTALNDAEISSIEFIVTVHVVPVPPHAPPQPANVEPVAGVSVSVTCVPGLKFAEQVEVQLIPAGELVTVEAPALLRLSSNS
jgi:hypothetical protein